jgi:hypothetical protein
MTATLIRSDDDLRRAFRRIEKLLHAEVRRERRGAGAVHGRFRLAEPTP